VAPRVYMPNDIGCQDFGVRAVNERDEQEIETRLRAAFQARSELVTHQKLRPGVPPNAHTAAKQEKRRGWAFSLRAALVPVSVAAALVGGIFVGAKLPNHSGTEHGGIQAGSSGGTSAGLQSGPPATGTPAGQATVSSSPATAPTTSSGSPATASGPTGSPAEIAFAGLAFQPVDWQLVPLDATTACVLPKGHEAPDKSAALPCGVDSLLIDTDAPADGWPVGTANLKEGWWPKAADAAAGSTVPCPGTKATAKNSVKSSATLRTDPKYPLSGTGVADYREWTVACTDGSGVVPRLWQVKGTKTVAVSAVSANARYDADLLRIVASMHTVNS
jgi:hypothetical protein